MAECLLKDVRDMFGNDGTYRMVTDGYQVKTDIALEGVDKVTGQAILTCQVEDCNAEVEVYANRHHRNTYDADPTTIKVARFVCLSMKENK